MVATTPAEVGWTAWPGGQTAALNPIETITSSDLGLSGQIDWTVDKGAVIVDPAGGNGTSATATQLKVRYDQVAASSNKTDAVTIEGRSGNNIIRTRRTVFRAVWQQPNFNAAVHSDNNLRFPVGTGTQRDVAGYNWAGENGSLVIAAKMEARLVFEPSGIDWAARGVHFIFSSQQGGKASFRLQRFRIQQQVSRPNSNNNRAVDANDAQEVYDGHSDAQDAQYPTQAKPNMAFRLDAPGGANLNLTYSAAYRADFTEVGEWHNGTAWGRVTPDTNAFWFANATAVAPNGAKGGDNNHGAGHNATVIPNQAPTAVGGPDQSVAVNTVNVALDGTQSTDPDGDTFDGMWTQTAGANVQLNPVAGITAWVRFTAPAQPDQLKFELVVKDLMETLHHHRPTNFQSNADEVVVNVTP